MSTFAPAYRPTIHRQPFLIRQQKLENRKRKRGQDSSDGNEIQTPTRQSPERDTAPPTASTFHPVNLTDPYHIAGHPRELPLPPPPFPHAPIPDPTQPKQPPAAALAELNPPLYLPPAAEDKSPSLKRRHLDNLTTILHRCMLNADWHRASRAWALLIRTEIQGRGIDVRRNGRWGIGAEVLMRRGVNPARGSRGDSMDDDTNSQVSTDETEERQVFSDEGFKLARQYYERLILQYPHTARTMHGFNAEAVYPALFNVWVYEVQDRARRGRRGFEGRSSRWADDGDDYSDTEWSVAMQQIRSRELEQALPIAQRMDELFLSPPYDSSSDLRYLRGMVARWISDLHDEMADFLSKELDVREREYDDTTEQLEMQSEIERHRNRAEAERRVAVVSFEKADAAR